MHTPSFHRDGIWSALAATHRPTPRVAVLLIVVLACLVYGNTLSNPLVFDDLAMIPQNRLLAHPADVVRFVSEPYQFPERPATLYRPFTAWTFAVNHAVNAATGRPGTHVLAYRLTNLLLHAAVGVAVFHWLTGMLPASIALWVALLFVAHPIHTDAVDQVVGRAEILAALFGVALLAMHRGRRGAVRCGLLYLFALWSKESAIAFAPVAVLMDVCFRHPTTRWPWRSYLAYGTALGMWVALRSIALAGHEPIFPFLDNPLVTAPALTRLWTALRVQLDYLRLQLLPVGLSSDYSYNQVPLISDPLHPACATAAIVLLAAAWLGWKLRSSRPEVSFGLAGYALLFLPTSNILMPIGTIMAERLAYSPSLMFCLLAGLGLWGLNRRWPRAAVTCAVMLVVACGGLTVARNRTWAGEMTFYAAQAESAPNSAKAHFGLGTVLAAAGRDGAAVEEYERALQIHPEYADVLFNLGNALRRLGRPPEEVMAAYRGAIRADPRHTHAIANLSRMLRDLNRPAEADRLLDLLGRIDPDYPGLERRSP